MKLVSNLSKISIVFLSFMTIFFSCDKINDPVFENTTTSDSDTVSKYRIVLLEEFTGQKCGNCPRAARLLYDTLVPKYGKNLITMAVHAGGYAIPQPGSCFTNDYRTPEGDAYDNLFGMSNAGNPDALINRIDSNFYKYKEQWDTEIFKLDTTPAQAWITVENSYNASSRTVTINVSTEFLQDMNGDYKLCLAVTEDSIVSCQLDYYPPGGGGTQMVTDYVHRHLFRGTVNNSAYGVFVTNNPQSGSTYEKSFTYVVPTNFNEQHCNIVAYVFNADTYEIVQAGEAEIIE